MSSSTGEASREIVKRAGPACIVAAALLSAFTLSACGGDQPDTSTDIEPASREVVSPRSMPFQKYSGRGMEKLHLAEFGTEGSRKDRLEAQASLKAFLAASGAGEWERACGFVSSVLLAQIEEIIRRSKRRPKYNCGEVLEALASPEGERPKPLSAPRGISSLRVKVGPGGGFALFHGSDGRDHWMAVRRDADGWKVLSPAPQLFE